MEMSLLLIIHDYHISKCRKSVNLKPYGMQGGGVGGWGVVHISMNSCVVWKL